MKDKKKKSVIDLFSSVGGIDSMMSWDCIICEDKPAYVSFSIPAELCLCLPTVGKAAELMGIREEDVRKISDGLGKLLIEIILTNHFHIFSSESDSSDKTLNKKRGPLCSTTPKEPVQPRWLPEDNEKIKGKDN